MEAKTLDAIAEEADELAEDIKKLKAKINVRAKKLESLNTLLKSHGYKRYGGVHFIPYTVKLREFIKDIQPSETICGSQFKEWLHALFPDNELHGGSMATAWRMLIQSGDIVKIRRGNRRNQAVYKVVNPAGTPLHTDH